jgi:urease accessory protein
MAHQHLTANEVLSKGTWQGTAADRVVLSYDDRFRRRIMLTSEQGREVLLSLKEAILLQNGDALLADGDQLIEVVAAPEKLIEIRCEGPHALLRTAWHLGNRHLATQIMEKSLRIRYDKVILEMVEGLGAEATVIEAPFNPEGGAYSGGGHTKVHNHHHEPDHDPHHHH